MSQASELLNKLPEGQKYEMNDDYEAHIVIEADRHIKVPEALRKIAVQFDHNVETVTFDCPRYWDNLDMSEMTVYINYIRPDRVRGMYLAKDVKIDDEDQSMMHFTWTLSRTATLEKGKLRFLVCIKKLDADGNEENHWNSKLNDEMEVQEGLECEDAVNAMHSDIITDLLLRMDKILVATTPILDTTLTERGLAADAKSTGDRIKTVNDDLTSSIQAERDILSEAISAETSARKAEVAVERERINKFTSLSSGSTTGDAELLDGRIDFKSNTWENIGSAIRETTKRLASGQWIDDGAMTRAKLNDNFTYKAALDSGDLDYLTADGCYFLNGVFTHSPFPDNNAFILTNFTVGIENPRTFQIAVSHYNNDEIYWRVVSTSSGGEEWHDLSIGNVYRAYGVVDNPSTFLTDYLTEGSYMFSYGHSIKDSPIEPHAFVLYNFIGNQNYIIQIVSSLSAPQRMYTRVYRNGEVTDWRLLTPNDSGNSPVIVNFGDSIFGMHQGATSISAKLELELNATVINGGLGGTTLEAWSDGLSQYFSMLAIVDAVTGGDWTTLETQAETCGVDYYPTTIANLKNLDFSTVTDITLNHGTNDWARSAVIENENRNDTSTYKGALRYVINSLQTAFPNAKISVISVLNRFDSGDGRTMVNGNGDTLEDFALAAKEVCSELYTNYINVFDNLGFNVNTREYYFGTSTVHPNENGNVVIAKHIAKNL